MAELGYYVVSAEGGRNGQGFVLINDIYVEHYSNDSRRKTRSKKSNRDVSHFLKGTLLREVELDEPFEDDSILCRNPESEVYFRCSKKDLKEISENVFDLLLAISNCRDRLDVFRRPDHLAEGLEMDVGQDVLVKIPNHAGEMYGVIRFKGEVNGKDGIQFGIELYNPDGKGNSNGSYCKERYFQCDNDAGIFLPLSRVRPMANRNQSPISTPRKSKHSRLSSAASTSRARSTETCPLTLGISKEELAKLGIKHGMEVYIFTEVGGRESQEKGKVKFIGRLPGTSSGGTVHVGIDLDRAVGSGTGLYKGKHLFYTRQHHAALVPLSGVLPAYVTDVHASPENNNHSNDRANQQAEVAKKIPHHLRNVTLDRRRYRENDAPAQAQKTFPTSSRPAPANDPGRGGKYLVPFVDGGRIGSSRRAPRSRRIVTDLYGADEPSKSRNHTADSRQRTPKISGRRPLHVTDSEDNSGDDTDLYGSDNSVVTNKILEKEDLVKHGRTQPTPRSSPKARDLHRQRDAASMPGVLPSPKADRATRNARSVPGYGRRFGDLPAELVDLNSISDRIPVVATGAREDAMEVDEMEVGTMVEVENEALGLDAEPGPTYGVIKWIGKLPNNGSETAAGVELEKPIPNGNDGTFNGVHYFSCDSGRGHFMFLKFCKKDPRFSTPEPGATANTELPAAPRDFGNQDSPRIQGAVPPPKKLVGDMVGKQRGIQGHHNSCYLDSTLFSLFAFSQVLDTILFRPRRKGDLPEYEETQKVLKELIINPLRKHHFVRADRIMQLRELLDKLGSTTGLVNEEKDPEEFLSTLLHQVFKAEPLHELRQGDSMAAHEGFFYQIFMERDEKFICPTTQQLLEKSLISADLKFRNVPVCLILQMPRFGKEYKMYKRLKPSLQLDITDLVEDMPRSCDVCESYAEFECRDCFMETSINDFSLSYCKECAQRVHSHRKRKNHNVRAIKLPDEFREYASDLLKQGKQPRVRRQTLELFAVVCIATSHYVSFAKCGTGKESTWVFFDSMADRVGEQNGYNIPEITPCSEVEQWLQLDGHGILKEDEKLMPELKRRLLCDSYMCMYQSRELMFNNNEAMLFRSRTCLDDSPYFLRPRAYLEEIRTGTLQTFEIGFHLRIGVEFPEKRLPSALAALRAQNMKV